MSDQDAARLDRLERRMDAQAAELLEVHGLEQAVDRLGDNAEALSATLLVVDKNQQALARLTAGLDKVETEAATKSELKVARKGATAEVARTRRSLLWNFYLGGALLALATALALVGVVRYQQLRHEAAVGVCQDRNRQNRIIVDVLESTVKASPNTANSANIRSAIVRFEALIVDCDRL